MRPMRIIRGLAHRLAQKITTSILCTRWLLRPWWVPCELYLGAWLTFASAGAPVVQRKSASAFGFDLHCNTRRVACHHARALSASGPPFRELSRCVAQRRCPPWCPRCCHDGAGAVQTRHEDPRGGWCARLRFYSPGHRRRVQTMHV